VPQAAVTVGLEHRASIAFAGRGGALAWMVLATDSDSAESVEMPRQNAAQDKPRLDGAHEGEEGDDGLGEGSEGGLIGEVGRVRGTSGCAGHGAGHGRMLVTVGARGRLAGGGIKEARGRDDVIRKGLVDREVGRK
jgi:hypothetical protein